MTIEAGTTIGRYQILGTLGYGGMASVYKAFQPALERVVALKVLRPAYAHDPEFLERFRREALAIARLRHPHIVQVHDFDEAAGLVFLVMEHVEGGSLKQKLTQLQAEGGGLPWGETARIVREVAEALAHAHAQGIVHRDVKPSNVMLTRNGRAVVTDFGIAKILAASGQTQTGVGVGTPEYMSPEQGQAAPVDHRSDIYSLGVLAYELLTGRVPFTADTPLAIVLAHVREPPPLPSKVEPRIGPRIEQVLLRALAKDPAARYPSATEFGTALDLAIAAEGRGGTIPSVMSAGVQRAAPRPAAVRRTMRVPAISITNGLFVIGVLGGVLLLYVLGAPAVRDLFRSGQAVLPSPTAPVAVAPAIVPTGTPRATATLATATLPGPPTSIATPMATPTVVDPTPKIALSGFIWNAATGVPLAGVSVTLWAENMTAQVAIAQTNAQGAYKLLAPNGSYWLHAEPSPSTGFVPTYWKNSVSLGGASPVVVSDASIDRLDIKLLTGFAVSGRVTGASGSPVRDAQVVAYDGQGKLVHGTRTDASGVYVFSLPNGSFKLVLCALGDDRCRVVGSAGVTVAGKGVTQDLRFP